MADGLRILVVGKDGTSRDGLAARIERLGATAQTAPDCLSAMGIVKSGEADMAILEEGYGGPLDAIDTARVLKSLRPDRYLPVLALVGETGDAGAPQRLLDADIDEVLGPAFNDEVLAGRLRAMSRLKSAHDQLRRLRVELEKTIARESELLKQLREDNRNLKVRCITDGLTNLYNYRYLMEWLKTEFKISRRYGHPLSLIIADIDHFKRVNDEYGHPCGDQVLKDVAMILKQCARESDLVARYAGDEFALVCPRSGRKEIRALAKRVLAACRKHPFGHKGKRLPISISMGTTTYPEDPEASSPERLVLLADQALYRQKRNGRNGVAHWDDIEPEMRLAIRCELCGPGHPLLAQDPHSRIELEAAARLVGAAAGTTSPGDAAPNPADEP